MSASVSSTSSSSSSSSREDVEGDLTEINTTSASVTLEYEDGGPRRHVPHISSRSSISRSSVYSLLFSSSMFPINFYTTFVSSSSFLLLSMFVAVLVSPSLGAESWSLDCQQTLYFGALNHSATLQCRAAGVNLYSNDITLSSTKWTKEPEEYTALETVIMQNLPAQKKNHASYDDRVSLTPSTSASSAGTDVSLTIANLKPDDFGEYEIEVTFARGTVFQKPKSVYPVILEEAHGPAAVRIVGNRPIRYNFILILKCEAEVVNPMPSIEWYHAGVKANVTSPLTLRNSTVDSATNRKKMDVVSEYNVVPSPSQNGDEVECRVSNPIIDGVEKSVSVVLNVTFPPTLPKLQLRHKHPDWIVANEDQLVVGCDLSDGSVGNPPAELALIRDDVVVLTKASADETKRIEFKTLVDRVDDAASFKCVAKNSIGEVQSESRRINVAYGPTSVEVNASATTVKAGETVSLRCAVEGTSPAPIIQWVIDGDPIQSYSNAIPVNETGVVIQEIQYTLKPEDNRASFHCQALNPISRFVLASNFSTFTVFYPSDEPELTVINEKSWYIEGDKSEAPTIQCHLGILGNPPARLLLSKSNETVVDSMNGRLTYRVHSFGAGDDHAAFRCEAWNAPQALPLPTDNSLEEVSAARFSRWLRIRVAYGPHFLKINMSEPGAGVHKAKMGENVVLSCRAWSSNPILFLEWIAPPNGSVFNEQALNPQGVTTVNLEYKVSERDNNKSFACRAENRKTKIVRESPVILKVYYGPKWIEEGRRTYSAREGNRKELVCPITANPPVDAWKWMRGGEEIKVEKPDSKMELRGEKGVKLPFKQTVYIIEQVSKADFGNYTCKASNNGGKKWISFPISLAPAQPPDIPLNCSQTNVDVDDLSISFACVAGFDGGAAQNRYKVQITSLDSSNNATLSNNLVSAPRKDESFRISFASGELQSLRLRRGREYKVRLQLCNRFGCSNFFEGGLDFFVPTTTTRAPTTATKVTSGLAGRGETPSIGPNAASGLKTSSFLALLSILSLFRTVISY